MPKVSGKDRLQNRLRFLLQKSREANTYAVVGYTQDYALIVHEDLEARHAEGKQAKYLEQPARELSSEVGSLVTDVYRKTKDMRKALVFGALRILRASQLIVPVDTSALKASGFVAAEGEEELKAAEAYANSRMIRQRSLERRAKAVRARAKKRVARRKRLERIKEKLRQSRARQRKYQRKRRKKRK